jgi:uncharacterized protein YbjT (DUF2867 family)
LINVRSKDDALRLPFGKGSFSPIATRDVAIAVAEITAHPAEHAGAIYKLTGVRFEGFYLSLNGALWSDEFLFFPFVAGVQPELVDGDSIAGDLNHVLGSNLKYQEITLDEALGEYRDLREVGALDRFVEIFQLTAQNRAHFISEDFSKIVYHQPTSLRDVFAENSNKLSKLTPTPSWRDRHQNIVIVGAAGTMGRSVIQTLRLMLEDKGITTDIVAADDPFPQDAIAELRSAGVQTVLAKMDKDSTAGSFSSAIRNASVIVFVPSQTMSDKVKRLHVVLHDAAQSRTRKHVVLVSHIGALGWQGAKYQEFTKMEYEVQQSNFDWTILRAPPLFQYVTPLITEGGTFVWPVGNESVWMLDAGDVALAASICALNGSQHVNLIYTLTSPAPVSASTISKALGFSVTPLLLHQAEAREHLQELGLNKVEIQQAMEIFDAMRHARQQTGSTDDFNRITNDQPTSAADFFRWVHFPFFIFIFLEFQAF